MKKIFVVCTGSSLKDFNFSLLKDKTCMVVNKAYMSVPNWKYMFAIDKEMFEDYNKDYDASERPDRVIYTIDKYSVNDIPFHLKVKQGYIDIVRLRKSKEYLSGYGYIKSFMNSGACALELAIKMGYDDIRLLGMDLGGMHYYDGKSFDYSRTVKYMEEFSGIVSMKLLDIQVLRYDSGDWIGFKKVGLEEVLK